MNATATTDRARTAPAIWGRIVERDRAAYPAELARTILKLDFDAKDQERIAFLLGKNQEGKLTAEEQSEIDEYLRVDAFLGVIRSKARIALKEHGSSPDGP